MVDGAFVVVIACIGVLAAHFWIARFTGALGVVVAVDRGIVAAILFVTEVLRTQVSVDTGCGDQRCIGTGASFCIAFVIRTIQAIIACDCDLIDASNRHVATVCGARVVVVTGIGVDAAINGMTTVFRAWIQVITRGQTVEAQAGFLGAEVFGTRLVIIAIDFFDEAAQVFVAIIDCTRTVVFTGQRTLVADESTG